MQQNGKLKLNVEKKPLLRNLNTDNIIIKPKHSILILSYTKRSYGIILIKYIFRYYLYKARQQKEVHVKKKSTKLEVESYAHARRTRGRGGNYFLPEQHDVGQELTQVWAQTGGHGGGGSGGGAGSPGGPGGP